MTRTLRRLFLLTVRKLQNSVLEPRRRYAWPNGRSGDGDVSDRVAVITVNFNTKYYVAYLIFCIYRVLELDAVHKIVVVDNASIDDSLPFLRALEGRGVIDLIVNKRQRYHGPALNQACSYLARKVDLGVYSIDYLWILDPDVLLLRRCTLSRALSHIKRSRAPYIGSEYGGSGCAKRYLSLRCFLLDPRKVWRPGVPVFQEAGAPSEKIQEFFSRPENPAQAFPFFEEEFAYHLGSASIHALWERKIRTNRYFEWAYHWRDITLSQLTHGRGREIFENFLECFHQSVPVLTGDSLADACAKRSRVTIPGVFTTDVRGTKVELVDEEDRGSCKEMHSLG